MAIVPRHIRTFRWDTSSPTVAPTTTTLAAAVTTTGQANLTLSAACGPNGTYIQIGTERMYVTSGGGSTTPTVQRGAWGTAAATYANGTTVDLPGHSTHALQEIADIPNQRVQGAKVTTDINYQVIVCGGSDVFPNGGTTIILADNTPNLGTLNLLAPGQGSTWMQFPSAGAAGPAGSGATPSALQITFSGAVGQLGVGLNVSFIATGGVAPYTFAISAGSLPTGLTLNTATGFVSGTPNATGTFSFTGKVTDAALTTAFLACTITITAATVPLATITAVTATPAQIYIDNNGVTYADIVITPTWSSGSGVQSVTVWLFYRSIAGGANAWYYRGVFQMTIGAILHFETPIYPGPPVTTAEIGIQAGSVQGDPAVSLGSSLPPGPVMSGTFTLQVVAPGTASSATLTNLAGAAPTQANVYVGINSLGNPYWGWISQFNPAGNSDPNANRYELWGAWTDSSGNLIAPGGPSNPTGWQLIASCANDANTHTFTSPGFNYPGPGIDGYFEFIIVARNINSTATPNITATGNPYSGDPNSTLQNCWAGFGGTYARIHIGSSPGTITQNPAAPQGNIATSLLWDPSFVFLNQIYGGRFIPANFVSGAPVHFWEFAQNTGSNIYAENADGPSTSNSLKLIGDGTHQAEYYETSVVTGNTPFNFSFQAKCSATAQSLFFSITWLDASLSPIGSAISSSVSGLVSWTDVFMGSYTSPSNAAYVTFQFVIQNTTPAGQWWKISDLLVQGVVNQTSNGQTNSTVPAAQTTGHAVAGGQSTSTTANSAYGLAMAVITASDTAFALMEAQGGIAGADMQVSCPGSTGGSAAMQAIPGGILIQVNSNATGHSATLTAEGFSGSVGGHAPFTGSLGGGRNCIGGIVY